MSSEAQQNEVAVAVSGELVERDPLAEFTEQWLMNRRFAANTREGYRRDVSQFLRWCAEQNMDPLLLRFTDLNRWGRELEEPAEGKPLAATTVARKMSAVSSWYAFLFKLGAVQANPAAAADRPEVDRDYSSTGAFTHEEASRMMRVARTGDSWVGPVAEVLATWLVELGTRASETTSVQVDDLGWNRGFRIVHMRAMKGGRSRVRVIPPPLAALLETYLLQRAASEGVEVEELAGPLFVGPAGQPLTRYDIYRFVRRLARVAGLPNASKVSPHWFRHAWNRMARSNGAALEDRQYAMGHRDPRTTRRYDRNDQALERDPSLLVAAAVAVQEEDHG
jgi:integrase/recombinase XerD